MSEPYNQTVHDASNGDSSHFDANSFYNNDPGSFANMDPNLTGEGADNLNNAVVGANAHLPDTSSTGFNAMLSHETTTSSVGGTQDLGGDESTVTTLPSRSGKASRACDECRRRKVSKLSLSYENNKAHSKQSKCTDGNPETGQACAPCRARSGPDVECHYNRTPMKRGPSKGYTFLIPSSRR